MILAFAQREAVEAGLVATGSSFAFAAAWQLWRRAAAVVTARFGGYGSGAVVVEHIVLDLVPGAVLWLFGRPTAARVLAGSRDGQARPAVSFCQLVTCRPCEPGQVRVLVARRSHAAAAAILIFLYGGLAWGLSLERSYRGRPTTAGAASHDGRSCILAS